MGRILDILRSSIRRQVSAYAWELLSFAGLQRVTKSSPAVTDQKCGNALPYRSHRLGHAGAGMRSGLHHYQCAW